VEDNNVFHFNTDFSAALYRIKVNTIQLKETVEENKKTNDQVLQDRQYQVRAERTFHGMFSDCSPLLAPSRDLLRQSLALAPSM
jgi:hypothetical protein